MIIIFYLTRVKFTCLPMVKLPIFVFLVFWDGITPLTECLEGRVESLGVHVSKECMLWSRRLGRWASRSWFVGK